MSPTTNNHAIRAIDLDNSAVETLATESIPPPTVKAPPKFDERDDHRLRTVQVVPGKLFTLTLMIPLAEGLRAECRGADDLPRRDA